MTTQVTTPLRFINETSKTATMQILVGSVQGTVTFNWDDKESKPIISFDANLKVLADAGFDFLSAEIKTTYTNMVADQAEIIKAGRRAKALAYYRKCWLFNLHTPTNSRASFEVESAADFAERWAESTYAIFPKAVKITYAGQTIELDYARDKGSFVLSGGPLGYGKRRYYKTVEQACKKAAEIIDEAIEAAQQAAASKARAAVAQNEMLNKLNLLFDGKVQSEDSWEAGVGYRNQGYKTTKYFIMAGERKLRLERYNSELFTFAGITKITADQVRKIIAIL